MTTARPFSAIAYRHLVMTAIMLAATVCAMAQPAGRKSVSVTYDYATKHRQSGFGFNFTFDIFERFRLEPEMIYFTTRGGVSTLNLGLSLHYLVPVAGILRVYPTAGISYTHWGSEGPDESRVSVLAGGGAELWLGKRWALVVEERLQLVSHESQALTTLGLRHSF